MSDDLTPLQAELAGDVRTAINRLRNYGLTLKDVHIALARELGYATGSLADRDVALGWFVRSAQLAITAYDLERLEMDDLAEQAVRDRPGRPRRARR